MIELNSQEKWMTGISYITVPKTADRTEFIHDCYMTGTVSITSEAGGIINKVPVSKGCMQLIEFPEEGETFGSQVVYVLDRIHNKQIVIDVLQNEDENSNNEENEYVIKRKFGDSVCEIRLNPVHESISITTSGDSPDILINNSKGSIETVSNIKKDTAVVSNEKYEVVKQIIVGNSNKYSRIIQTDTNILVEIDKFVLSKEEQAFVLGNVLKEFFDKVLDTIANSTVSTAIGVQSLINKLDILKLKEETKKFLSENFFMKNNENVS